MIAEPVCGNSYGDIRRTWRNHHHHFWKTCSSKQQKTSKLRISDPLRGNPMVTSGFPSQLVSNAESILLKDMFRLTAKPRKTPYHLSFLGGTRWWPVDSLHNWPVMRKWFSCRDVWMVSKNCSWNVPWWNEIAINSNRHMYFSKPELCFRKWIQIK